MREQFKNVLVFKTDKKVLTYQEMVQEALMDYKDIIKWNVDMDDQDKVLRIECDSLSAEEIILKMKQAEFFCEELKD
ncbi:hypothetical protein [Sporocytophaga sp.]|uniref:hypothetical protein n=1 Tax=Sporocytophaga sp. TaxID=2231183 RepID=UPI0025E4D909|nr:hypothetical protein [Sporocytophaga sp.]